MSPFLPRESSSMVGLFSPIHRRQYEHTGHMKFRKDCTDGFSVGGGWPLLGTSLWVHKDHLENDPDCEHRLHFHPSTVDGIRRRIADTPGRVKTWTRTITNVVWTSNARTPSARSATAPTRTRSAARRANKMCPSSHSLALLDLSIHLTSP